ncbi:MAG: sulfite exporter TauE/SafE family protein [Glaciecola sp.]
MIEFSLVSAFLIGLAGGVHCIGMCGGIASAFSFAIPPNGNKLTYISAYNLGRIFSYTVAGAITGFIGSIFNANVASGLAILQILSIVFLLLLALYISDLYKGLSALERQGAKLWRHVSPLAKQLVPFKNPFYTTAYGAIWGWLPCGLVYSALTWSLSSGNALDGASFMLFFGLGTLPAVFATSLGASFLIPLLQNAYTRKSIAVALFLFAIFLTFELYQGIK